MKATDHKKQSEKGITRGAVTSRERSLSLDLARGLMLLLIVLAHAPIFLFGLEPGVMNRPESVTKVDGVIDFISQLFVDNRARPMFAALFGYGMVLVIERQLEAGTDIKEARRLLKRRAFFLIFFGIVLSVIIGGDDILAAYGIASLLIGWTLFRHRRVFTRTMIIICIFFLFWLPLAWMVIAYELGGLGFDSGLSATNTYADMALERLLGFPFISIFIQLLFPVVVPMLIGMWAAKKRLLTEPQIHRHKLKLIAIIGLSVSIIGGLPLALYGTQWWEPAPVIAGLVYALHMITGFFGGFGYAAMFGLIGSALTHPGKIAKAIAALGKRSLTFYVFNETMLVILLSPVAFGLGGMMTSTSAAVVAIFIWLTAMGLAVLLEKKKMRGPLDALLRQLIYRK
ncbi:DUF418 domain-containing protein [Evansella halocellulosilytica]|uniref:DUF418 domain-containing protein n=1 Tax=Evansella halocellulosilytica TaxID=2011013 RepID=UPI000BB7AF64|nr:DUF418 domain-containing protein [Evansella halocellulosilytica]